MVVNPGPNSSGVKVILSLNPAIYVILVFLIIAITFLIVSGVTQSKTKLIEPENLEVVIKYDGCYYNTDEMNPSDYFNYIARHEEDGEVLEMVDKSNPKPVGGVNTNQRDGNINENTDKENIKVTISCENEANEGIKMESIKKEFTCGDKPEIPHVVGAGEGKSKEPKRGDSEVEDNNNTDSYVSYTHTPKGYNNNYTQYEKRQDNINKKVIITNMNYNLI